MKQNLIKLALALIAIVLLALWLSHKNRPTTFTGPSTVTESGDNLVIHQKSKPDVKIYQPDPDSTVITTDSKGNVTVIVKHFGAGFDPGIGSAYSDCFRLTLDARLLYYNRFGLNAGLALGSYPHTKIAQPFVAVSYALTFKKFSNTSLFVGMTMDKQVIGGGRVRF